MACALDLIPRPRHLGSRLSEPSSVSSQWPSIESVPPPPATCQRRRGECPIVASAEGAGRQGPSSTSGSVAKWYAPATGEVEEKRTQWRPRSNTFRERQARAVEEIRSELLRVQLELQGARAATKSASSSSYSSLVPQSLERFRSVCQDSYVVNQVLKTLQDPDLAVAFLEWAKRLPRFAPNVATFSIILRVCGRAKRYDRISKYLEEMQTYGVPFNAYIFNELIKFHARGNRVKEAMGYFETMKKMNFNSNVYTYSMMIDLTSRTGDYSKTYELMVEMQNLGIEPNIQHCNTFIAVCGKLGRLEDCLTIYKSMAERNLKPDLVTYTTLIDLFQKAGRFGTATEFYDNMLRENIKPDIVIFTSLLHMRCRTGCLESAVSGLRQEMDKAGVVPDVVWYSILIHRCVKDKKMDIAECVLGEMRSRSVVPNVITFFSLFSGYFKLRDFEKMDALLEEMRALEITSDLDTYAHVFRLLNQCSKEKERIQIWKLLEKIGHPIHDSISILLQNEYSPKNDQDFDFSQMIACLENSKKDHMLKFSDILIEVMLDRGLHELCVKYWAGMKSIGVLNNALVSGSLQWNLDIRRMSRTTAKFCVKRELLALEESRRMGLASEFPRSFVIITGNPREGSESQWDLSLRSQVKGLLDTLHSPFAVLSHNSGRLIAEGWRVENWLSDPNTISKLSMFD